MAFILMIIWLLLASLPPSCYSHGSAQYECGPHGRFEYCIDDIPGCVIGCHCHPGYYFDTDTKICEPSIKLRDDFRRNYMPQPTRIQNPMYDSETVSTDLTPTITNPVDAKIDEITKDADDLGDWLYNQFFKTIENQVINSTSGDEQLLTRRSGSMVKSKPKRRSRKHRKRNGKKSKYKKKGLRKKLLRITEDDSLFDSSSGSTSDEDSSSSDSDSDTDSSSDNEKDSKDHGHKKIIIFNKKPKPPLPSFIFLPNMDTPFYPPIGLPPPPVIPMYPFVPVPPVAPIFPYPGFTPQGDEKDISTSTSASPLTITTITASTTTVVSSSKSTTTTARNADNASNSEPASSTTAASITSTDKPSFRSRDLPMFGKMLSNKNKHAQRNKLLQKLKDKINRRNKLNQIRPLPDDYLDMEEPLMDSMPKFNYNRQMQTNGLEEETPMEDVDFKYLTELIHRVDLNNTRKPLTFPMGPKMPSGGRRNLNTNPNYLSEPVQSYHSDLAHRIRTNPDDNYYSKLGRQIASMIRKIDTHGDTQIDIEVEKEISQAPEHPIFNENSHASRSFWERSVRSPLKTYFEPRNSKFTYLKHSNEDLFNLENIVEVAVSTNPPLSLREIENIINKMALTKKKIQKANDSMIAMPSHTSLNVDLLSKNTNKAKNLNYTSNSTIRYEHMPLRDNFYRFILNNAKNPTLSTSVPTTNTDHQHVFLTHNKRPTRKPLPNYNNYALKKPMKGYNKFLNIVPTLTTTKRPAMYRWNPSQHNQRSNYFTNNNQYVYEKTSYPYYSSSIFRKYNQPASKSPKQSYFHHELHHFDYFEK